VAPSNLHCSRCWEEKGRRLSWKERSMDEGNEGGGLI
jgi:hypothetical protein